MIQILGRFEEADLRAALPSADLTNSFQVAGWRHWILEEGFIEDRQGEVVWTVEGVKAVEQRQGKRRVYP